MRIVEFLKQNYVLTGIIVLGSVLRLYRLDFQSVWMDEVYTMNISNPAFTLKQMHEEIILREGFPDFYFFLLRCFYAIFGYADVVARLVSALAGIGGIIAIYMLGKEIFNAQVALLSAFLLSINEFHIGYSQEARPYALFFLLAIVTFLRLSVFLKQPTIKNALWYGLAGGIILNINFFGLVTLFSQGILVAFYLLGSLPQNRIQIIKKLFFSGLVVLLMAVPNYEMFLKLTKINSFWTEAPKPDSLTVLFREFLGNSEVTMFVFGVIFIYYIIHLLKQKTDTINLDAVQNNKLNYSFCILFVWFTTFTMVIIYKSYTGVPLFLSRYFISIVPVFILTLAIGMYLIRNRLMKAIIIVSIVIFTFNNLIVVKRYYTNVSKTQFREVTNFIKENNTNNEPVYTSLKYWFDYFLNNKGIKTNLTEVPNMEHIVNEMMQDTLKKRNFWYVDAHGRPLELSPGAQKFLAENFIVENNADLYDAWGKHYVKSSEARTLTVDIKKYLPLKKENGDKINYSIDILKITDTEVSIFGWAALAEQDATDSEIQLLALVGENTYKIPSEKAIRPDVTKGSNNKYKLDNTGFNVSISKESLPKGKSQLAIIVRNPKTNKEGIILTDKFFE